MRWVLWLSALVLFVWIAPKLNFFPPDLTNAVWARKIVYEYRVVEGAPTQTGTVACGYYFDSYPYWEGDLEASRGSIQYAADEWCADVPARLSEGTPPRLRYVPLRRDEEGRFTAMPGWPDEESARAHMHPGDVLLEMKAPMLFGRLV